MLLLTSLHDASGNVQLCAVIVGSFKRRKRKSIIVTVLLLIVSVLILVFGLAATTRTQNITVGGYYSGVIVSIHSYLIVAATNKAQQACSLSEFIISEVRVFPMSSSCSWTLKVFEGCIFPTFIIQHHCH